MDDARFVDQLQIFKGKMNILHKRPKRGRNEGYCGSEEKM
jgi:hypothetical protein